MRSIIFILLCLCCLHAAGAQQKKRHKTTVTQTYIDGTYTGTGIYLDPENIKEEKIKRRSTKDTVFIKRYVTCKHAPQLANIKTFLPKNYNRKERILFVIDGYAYEETEQIQIEPNAIDSFQIFNPEDSPNIISCRPPAVVVLIITKEAAIKKNRKKP
ncbi:hypothetical protein [Chitinophaga sp. Cy-1792]|uniref:hypothetical protein n=1 Tax=Chitinophaga sp. Cy-1792 TaxID=2608339 RepID=UPI00141DB364|nr:hypothetical protein [Chitinophaga sp. Cy-1792]NIG52975.1 hypothetical protein [Chitinophaga sp. Cy-1792]